MFATDSRQRFWNSNGSDGAPGSGLTLIATLTDVTSLIAQIVTAQIMTAVSPFAVCIHRSVT